MRSASYEISKQMPAQLSFWLDVDNTLLDNDALKEYLDAQVRAILGEGEAARFWVLYEEVRAELDVVDLPLTVRRYVAKSGNAAQGAALEHMLETIPFSTFLYPKALDVIRHLRMLGRVCILSDGDEVFQRRKIERSGLAAAVDHQVLIYTHKEEHLAEVTERWPAERYVLVDDKARILEAIARQLGDKVTTVHVRQGHYGREPLPPGFQPDISVAKIGDLLTFGADAFLGHARSG